MSFVTGARRSHRCHDAVLCGQRVRATPAKYYKALVFSRKLAAWGRSQFLWTRSGKAIPVLLDLFLDDLCSSGLHSGLEIIFFCTAEAMCQCGCQLPRQVCTSEPG